MKSSVSDRLGEGRGPGGAWPVAGDSGGGLTLSLREGTIRPGPAASPLNGSPGAWGGSSTREVLGRGVRRRVPWTPRTPGSHLDSRLLFCSGRWKQMHVSVPEAGGPGVGRDCHSCGDLGLSRAPGMPLLLVFAPTLKLKPW